MKAPSHPLRVAVVAVLLLAASIQWAAGFALQDEKRGVLTIAPILEKVTPGVVNISVLTRVAAQTNPLLNDPFFRRFFGVPEQPPEREAMAAGSGVIVDAARGYVLTNNHVIEKAEAIRVTLKDGRQFDAKLVGSDPDTDIALLKIDAANLTAVPIGDSGSLRVGDFVVAIGNPFAIGQTVTSGIVSALGRTGLSIEGYEDFIQTDASINPGNSGGALIDSKGELVGINTAIIAPGGGNVGIGFAVPSTIFKGVMSQLIRFGEVRRGRLGVIIQDLTPAIADALGITVKGGAIVTEVEDGSPADAAGIRAGDVVVAVDDASIRGSSDLRNRIGLIPLGETVALSLLRDGKPMTVSVKVGAVRAVEVPGEKAVPELSGAVFRPAANGEGVLVAGVEAGSPAWRFGLRKGDRIVGVNRKRVKSLDEFVGSVKRARNVIALNVVRDGSDLFIVIQR